MNTNEPTPASLRIMAMNLLARREHSVKELRMKLAKKCDREDLIFSVVAKLQNDSLQSDDRFAKAFTAMRLRMGKGAKIIRLELKDKGITSELIDECLTSATYETDWNSLALKAYQKKFDNKPIESMKEKSKRARFLMSRGFSADNVQYVFKMSAVVDD